MLGIALRVDPDKRPRRTSMKRVLLPVSALLSLLLGLTMAGLWWRSVCWQGEMISICRMGRHEVQVASLAGRIHLIYYRFPHAEFSLSSTRRASYSPSGTRWFPPVELVAPMGDNDKLNVGAGNWLLVMLFLVAPAWWMRQPARPRSGSVLCAQCGYDLRASKDACPECGTAIPSSTRNTSP